VAELLTQGLSNLAMSARWAALIGALLGLALEAGRVASKGRFWLSGVGIGLAAVIMIVGAAWFKRRRPTGKKGKKGQGKR